MATVFKLTDVANSTLADLYGGVLRLLAESWSTRTPAIEGGYAHSRYGAQPAFKHLGVITEAFSLVGQDTRANLLTAATTIEQALEAARLWHADKHRRLSTWLEAHSDGEGARRSLVYEGSLSYPTAVGVSHLLDRTTMRAQVNLTRAPTWENTTASTVDLNNLSTLGGSAVVSSVPGVYPARLTTATIKGRDGGGTELYRAWIGLRPAYEGSTTFTGCWELELGARQTDATEVVDAGASGGKLVRVDFATVATMANRVQIELKDLPGAMATDFIGRYLVLARCRLTAGATTAAIRLYTGYQQESTGFRAPIGENVYVTNTNWRLIPLGELSIPPYGYRNGMTGIDEDEQQVYVYAERLEGPGALDLDCLVLIPSTHYAYVEGARIVYNVEGYCPVKIYTLEDDTVLAMGFLSSPPFADKPMSIAYETRDFYLPTGNVLAVVAAEGSSAHALGGSVDVDLSYYPRWASYRGT